jgi:hypothetical protein
MKSPAAPIATIQTWLVTENPSGQKNARAIANSVYAPVDIGVQKNVLLALSALAENVLLQCRRLKMGGILRVQMEVISPFM